jgi:ATP-dependent DNA helicase DinG
MSDKIKLKYDLRLEQKEMLDFTTKSIQDGNKYILLNSPTGTGKSYGAILISKWYRDTFGADKKITILTGSKILQNQYINDFPFIKNLKGQSNYYCETHKTNCRTGKELNKLSEKKCKYCSYDSAKKQWLDANMAITNFHLFNIYSIYYPDILYSKYKSLLIIDEAHDFETTFNNFLSITINLNIIKKCGFSIDYQNFIKNKLSELTTIESCVSFINDVLTNDMVLLKDSYVETLTNCNDNEKPVLTNYITNITEQLFKLISFSVYYKDDKDNWVMDINTNKKTDTISISLQPIWSYSYLKDIVWDKFDHVVFLSGTILDKQLFSYVNGIDVNVTSYTDIETTFPEENRLIYYIKKIGKMTYNDKFDTFKKQIPVVNKILKKYKQHKGIIHTGNYEISEWLKNQYNNDRLIYHDPNDREEKLNDFIYSNTPNVIVSPSMGTGISLDGNLGRFGIVLKIPYPNITNPQVKNRILSNEKWYNWYTTTQIIQSLGRIVRSDIDYGENYILDASFSNILENGYVPKYIIDSIRLLK